MDRNRDWTLGANKSRHWIGVGLEYVDRVADGLYSMEGKI